jgi:hypothetical protein
MKLVMVELPTGAGPRAPGAARRAAVAGRVALGAGRWGRMPARRGATWWRGLGAGFWLRGRGRRWTVVRFWAGPLRVVLGRAGGRQRAKVGVSAELAA